ncbi:MAG: twin-arginine translocase subunit TatC [Thermoplasmatota archaeon]
MDASDALRLAAIAFLGLTPLAMLWYLLRRPAPEATMGLLDHVEELRRRILYVLATIFIGALFAFSFRIDNWTPKPAVQDNIAAQLFQRITDHLVPDTVQLVVTRPMDGFLAEMMIAGAIGMVLAGPVFLYHASRYIGPALRPQEIRTLQRTILPATLLFLAGAAFAWYAVLPFLLKTLYGYSEALGATSLLSINELVSFTLTMMITLGIAFETPLIMYALSKADVVKPATYTKYWRHATVAIFILSALITDPTIISQVMVAAPLLLLYWLGVLWATTASRSQQPEAP